MMARETLGARMRSGGRRTAIVAGLGVAGLVLSSCSGGDDPAEPSADESSAADAAGAPADASVEDFCEAFNSLQEDLVDDIDLNASPEEQADAAAGLIREYVQRLEEVGTPEDIPAQARDGFDAVVQVVQDLPESPTTEDIAGLEDSLSGAQQEASDAFGDYATETCPSVVPSDLPTDQLPSGVPSDIPTELPSDIPTELLEDLPSDFATEDLPSDFPTELLEELENN